jgi:hypothetical protein
MIWRAIKLLARAAWGILGFLGLAVTLDSGWAGFYRDVKKTGLIEWASDVWSFICFAVATDPMAFVVVLLCVALLYYVLIDRAKERSKAAFEAQRNPRARKTAKGKAKRK